MDRARLLKMKEKLKRLVADSESRVRVDSAKTENDLRSLIKEYTGNIAKLSYSEGAEFKEALSQLTFLRRKLSQRLKMEQQQLIEKHWQQVQQMNAEFIDDLREDLQDRREKLEDEVDANEALLAVEMEHLEELRDEWYETAERLDAAVRENQLLREELSRDESLEVMQRELDRDFDEALGDLRGFQPPKPDFKRLVKRTMELDGAFESREHFEHLLKEQTQQEFRAIAARLRAQSAAESSEEQATKIESVAAIYSSRIFKHVRGPQFQERLSALLDSNRRERELREKFEGVRKRLLGFAKGDLHQLTAVIDRFESSVERLLDLEQDAAEEFGSSAVRANPIDRLRRLTLHTD